LPANWQYWNDSADGTTNPIHLQDTHTAVIDIASTTSGASGHACYIQDAIVNSDNRLTGKTLQLKSALWKSTNNNMNLNPYVAIAYTPISGGMQHDVVKAELGSMSSNFQIVAKSFVVPTGISKIRVVYCVQNAGVGQTKADWISLCEVQSSTSTAQAAIMVNEPAEEIKAANPIALIINNLVNWIKGFLR